MPTIEKPGSYKDFLEQTGSSESSESVSEYSVSLQNYRLARAAELGITLDELHTSPLTIVET